MEKKARNYKLDKKKEKEEEFRGGIVCVFIQSLKIVPHKGENTYEYNITLKHSTITKSIN